MEPGLGMLRSIGGEHAAFRRAGSADDRAGLPASGARFDSRQRGHAGGFAPARGESERAAAGRARPGTGRRVRRGEVRPRSAWGRVAGARVAVGTGMTKQAGLGAIVVAVVTAAMVAVGAARAEVPAACEPPVTLIVLDRSSSMTGPSPGAASKWVAARGALDKRLEVRRQAQGAQLIALLFEDADPATAARTPRIPANPPHKGVHPGHLATMSLPVGMPEEPSGTT